MRTPSTLVKRKVLRKLRVLQPWVYHQAATGSVYIKFKGEEKGTLRIADHPGRPIYRYRWNIIIGGDLHQELDRNVMRYYFGEHDLRRFYEAILAWHQVVSKPYPLENIRT